MIRTIYFENGAVYILNQNQLPHKVEYERISTHQEIAQAIRELKVRGAPLIGVTAAYGLALAVRNYTGSGQELDRYYQEAEKLMAATRPTAVNLFWGINRMKKVFQYHRKDDLVNLRERLLDEAQSMCLEDVASNIKMGEIGQAVLPEGNILTICNTGALATCGYGTALGVIRSAYKANKIDRVWVCETRPVLQGARLTIWELIQDKIPATLITDSMAAYLMQQSKVDAIVVGADRIAANGDVANKIGTFSLAVLGNYHQVPFYVAAPRSTIDFNISFGGDIPIEERDHDEVRCISQSYLTLPEVEVYNPAFDVTPAELITGIITEAGIITAPYGEGLLRVRGL